MKMNPFLEKEYGLCFEQLRYYDTRHIDILKYLVSLASAVATALFALYKYFDSPCTDYYTLQALLSGVVFLGGLLLYFSMNENRLYFIRTARQINAIRNYCLKSVAQDFEPDNQLWRDPKIRSFRLGSVHTYHLIGAAIINSVFLGICVHSIFIVFELNGKICVSCLVAFVAFLLQLAWSAYHLTAEETGSRSQNPRSAPTSLVSPNH